jgi:hypothetical protein
MQATRVRFPVEATLTSSLSLAVVFNQLYNIQHHSSLFLTNTGTGTEDCANKGICTGLS